MSSFVAIDVETANPFMGSICQIGAVRFEAGREVDHIDWLIDPRQEFDPLHVAVHGIDAQAVAGQPMFGDRHADLCAFTADAVVVCHTHFDRIAISRACAAAERAELDCRWLDSARVARRTWPQVAQSGYGIANLAKIVGIDFRHHHAVEDARVAGAVLLRAIADSGLALNDWFARVEQPLAGPARDDLIRRAGSREGPLAGEVLVFTGALEMPRREAADIASALGAEVHSGVTRETTVLVVGDQDLYKLNGATKSNKHRKAEQLIASGQPIRILAESDFLALGGSSEEF